MYRRIQVILSLLTIVLSIQAQSNLVPAFPGAEGFGRFTQGGRGGMVVHVTNLNDSGIGSLRAAVSSNNKKIVVFDVGGTIELKSELRIGANTTIAGQTAPDPGITLRYYSVRPNGNNIIMRFIRIRRGNEKDVSDADCIFARHYNNLLFDHCSFSWSIDEVASFYDNNNFTMQWSTICEALTNAGHSSGGAHGFGGIWGGKGASFHHNLLAHLNNRTPRFCGARYNWDGYDKSAFPNSVQAERVDLRNNVMYNWGTGNGAYGGAGGYHNIINNYYKAGPATKNKTRVFQCSINDGSNSGGVLPDGLPGLYYINGNYVTAAGTAARFYDWKGVTQDSGRGITVKANGESTYIDEIGLYGPAGEIVNIKLTVPVEYGVVTTHSAEEAYQKVLQFAGSSLYRDAEDTRYAEEAKSGTATYKGSVTKLPGIIDKVEDVGGYNPLESTIRPHDFDTDKDGIPDKWEIQNGLNPNDANDALLTTIDERGWYTNIEVYINSLVQKIVIDERSDAEMGVEEYFPPFYDEEGHFVADIITTSSLFAEEDHTTYYCLDGTKRNALGKGISIKVSHFKNGHIKTTKILKQ